MVVLLGYLKTIAFLDHVHIILYLRTELHPPYLHQFVCLNHERQQSKSRITRHQPQCIRLHQHNGSRLTPPMLRSSPDPHLQLIWTSPTNWPQSFSNIGPLIPPMLQSRAHHTLPLSTTNPRSLLLLWFPPLWLKTQPPVKYSGLWVHSIPQSLYGQPTSTASTPSLLPTYPTRRIH